MHPRVELDFTSFTEGWALEEITSWLTSPGAGDFLLEVGGELRASGSWQVASELPAGPLVLTSCSLATSGTCRQWRTRQEGAENHLIDPRTGYPVRHGTVSVSVLAADSLTADGWATALIVLGAVEGLPLIGSEDLSKHSRPGRLILCP